jgi:hypothetical protein
LCPLFWSNSLLLLLQWWCKKLYNICREDFLLFTVLHSWCLAQLWTKFHGLVLLISPIDISARLYSWINNVAVVYPDKVAASSKNISRYTDWMSSINNYNLSYRNKNKIFYMLRTCLKHMKQAISGRFHRLIFHKLGHMWLLMSHVCH